MLQSRFWREARGWAGAETTTNERTNQQRTLLMPKCVIERTIPNAGNMSARELHGISGKSCRVLRDLSPQIQLGAQLRHR